MKKFLCEYRFNGGTYGVTIVARSWDDAQDHLNAIGHWGKVVGSDPILIPVPAGGLLLRLWNWFRG